jgi:phosphoribosylglycinamide formyltransferase-1
MEIKKLNLAVLISGRGSNLKAIIDACKDPAFPACINVVISNNGDAAGLLSANKANIDTAVVNHKEYSEKSDFEYAINNVLKNYEIDLICLAGFMRILSEDFINKWEDSIINIHPSLLPAYKGLNTHERAIKDGCKKSGCTVHFVRPEIDSGPIILQRDVDIKKDDTPETLANRILEQEHKAYPEAIRLIAQGTNNLLSSAGENIS